MCWIMYSCCTVVLRVLHSCKDDLLYLYRGALEVLYA